MARSVILTGPVDASTGTTSTAPVMLVQMDIPSGQAFSGEVAITGDGSSLYRVKLGEATTSTLRPLLPISFPIKQMQGPQRLEITVTSPDGSTVYPFAYISGTLGAAQ